MILRQTALNFPAGMVFMTISRDHSHYSRARPAWAFLLGNEARYLQASELHAKVFRSGPAQPAQTPGRLIQGFIALAEGESHLLCSIAWIVVEARSRHRGHAYFFHQVLRERYVVAKSETADVSHHVIRAPWAVTAEPSLRQRGNKPVTPPPITFGELLVINWRQTQSRRSGFLQRSRRSDSQKVVYFANRVCDLRRSNSPANTPPCHRICFRHAIDRDRALAHAIERSDRDVLRTVIQDMLVNFVRYGEYVELHTKIANQLQFGARENLAGRIIRRVYHDRLRVVMKRASQFPRIEHPFVFRCFRRVELHQTRPFPRNDRNPPPGFLKRPRDY